MPRFSQDPFFQVETRGHGLFGRHLFFPALNPSGNPRWYLGFHWIGTTAALELSEADLARLFCHDLIQRMPEEGLKEAAESLSAMYEFYNLPVPAPKALPVTRSVPVRVTSSHVRPVHPVAEDY